MSDCIFCKIIAGEIPSKQVYKDDLITAFYDINPVAPVHVLIVPNEHIPSVNEVQESHEAILGRMFTVAKKIAAEHGIAERGYRLVVNTGAEGGQEVFHLHMHLLGGRKLGKLG